MKLETNKNKQQINKTRFISAILPLKYVLSKNFGVSIAVCAKVFTETNANKIKINFLIIKFNYKLLKIKI